MTSLCRNSNFLRHMLKETKGKTKKGITKQTAK